MILAVFEEAIPLIRLFVNWLYVGSNLAHSLLSFDYMDIACQPQLISTARITKYGRLATRPMRSSNSICSFGNVSAPISWTKCALLMRRASLRCALFLWTLLM